MAAMDAQESRTAERAEAYEEAPDHAFPWYVGGARTFGLVPGSHATEAALRELDAPSLSVAEDRDRLDRMRDGFTPKAEARYSVVLLRQLLDALSASVPSDDLCLALNPDGYLRLTDTRDGTEGFLGPIVGP